MHCTQLQNNFCTVAAVIPSAALNFVSLSGEGCVTGRFRDLAVDSLSSQVRSDFCTLDAYTYFYTYFILTLAVDSLSFILTFILTLYFIVYTYFGSCFAVFYTYVILTLYFIVYTYFYSYFGS